MANKNLNIWVRLKGAAKAERSFKGLGGAIKNNIAKLTALGVGIGTVTKLLKSSIDAYGKQELAEKKLETALGKTSKSLLNQATALQKVTMFGDEEIIEAQALIASFVKEEESVKAATKATLDLAAAKGMDLKAAADLVSKTLGSSTNALSRYGIVVEGDVGSTERLTSLTSNMAKVFGGQATEQAKTMTGQIQQMNNAIGDAAEALGEALAPAVIKTAQYIKALTEMLITYEGQQVATHSVTHETTRELLAQIAAAEKGSEAYKNLVEALGEFNQPQQEQKETQLEVVDNLKNINRLQSKYQKKLEEIPKINTKAKKSTEDLMAAEELAAQMKIASMYEITSMMTSTFAEHTAAAKAALIIQATMDAYGAANRALMAFPPPYGAIAAAAVYGMAMANVAKIAGFQYGGEFMVGGHGGTDSQVVPIRATPGERVIVQTPEQQAVSNSVNIVIQGNVIGNKKYVRNHLIPEISDAIRKGYA